MAFVVKVRSVLTGALALCVALAIAPGVKGFGAEDASAYYWEFYNGTITNGSRAIGPYLYLYGVGWSSGIGPEGGDNVCIGAKTRSDGSGGNAIPFLCTFVPVYGTRWTPGGQSNYGYPTAIADSDPFGAIIGKGVVNRD